MQNDLAITSKSQVWTRNMRNLIKTLTSVMSGPPKLVQEDKSLSAKCVFSFVFFFRKVCRLECTCLPVGCLVRFARRWQQLPYGLELRRRKSSTLLGIAAIGGSGAQIATSSGLRRASCPTNAWP